MCIFVTFKLLKYVSRKFLKVKKLLTYTFECVIFVSNRFQVGSNKEKVDFFNDVQIYDDLHILTF
jgi:hypothetical protein